MFEERPAAVPGAVLWSARHADGGPVLPDGCMDLIWLGDRLVVAGPDTRAFTTGPVDTEVVGLRFAPGTAPTLLGVAAHEVRDRRVTAEELWGAAGRRLAERVGAATDRAAVLEAWATRRWADQEPPPVASAVAAALRSGRPVAEVADEVGVGARQLHRLSLGWYGYGPKVLARVLRFQRALTLVDRGVGAAAAAAQAGYADQPHLAREVRALTGTTLGALRG